MGREIRQFSEFLAAIAATAGSGLLRGHLCWDDRDSARVTSLDWGDTVRDRGRDRSGNWHL